jgi:alpha-galactosidase
MFLAMLPTCRYLAVVLFASCSLAQKPSPVAQTPPMGWNSWDSYGLTITERQFRDNVRVLKSKLAPFGYNYAVIDEGWYFENPQDREKPETLHYALDSHGRYVPVPARFPSAGRSKPVAFTTPQTAKLAATVEETSFVALGRWVHAQGLKFGIHIIRGIPRASVERNMPIDGSDFHAQDAADTSDACPWDPTSWGVKENAAGQAWYDSLMRQYAAWGVDLLKVDCIGDHPYKVDEIRMIRRAIDKAGRPMVLSVSPGPMDLAHADEAAKLANMWRISDDEWDVWSTSNEKKWPQGVKDQFPRLAAWAKYAKPGTWPDADMLAIGELRPAPGWDKPRYTRLSEDERKTLITLWAMSRSPLIVGANLTLLDETTLKLLTNKDVIAIDQTATKSEEDLKMLNKNYGTDAVSWRAELPDGRVALAFFNLGEKLIKESYHDGDLGNPQPFTRSVRDVWAQKELGVQSSLSMTVPPHGCVLYLLH